MGLVPRGGNKHGKGTSSSGSSSSSKCSCFFFLKIFRTWRCPWCGEESDSGIKDGVARSAEPAPLVVDDGFGQLGVVEPGIDRKASEFIKKFHETHRT